MELVLIIYLIDTVLSTTTFVKESMLAVTGLSLIVGLTSLPLWWGEIDDTVKRMLIKIAPWWFGTLLVLTLVPSTATTYKMLAAYGATELVQVDAVNELGVKSMEVINKVMDDYLSEGAGESK